MTKHGTGIQWTHHEGFKGGGDPSEWPEDLRVREIPGDV